MSPEESDKALLEYMQIDAAKWAEEFLKIYPDVHYDDAHAWFSNAINAGKRSQILEQDKFPFEEASAPTWPGKYGDG